MVAGAMVAGVLVAGASVGLMNESDPTGDPRRTAIITGAGAPDGIGFAAARRLALAGMNVVIGATSERIHERAAELRLALEGAAGGAALAGSDVPAPGVVPVIADLTEVAGAEAVVQASLEHFGRIDVLVNNAGMTSVSDPQAPADIDEIGLDGWNHALTRNLTTSFLMTRAALPHLRQREAARIVMVSSVSGPLLAYPGDVGYHAGKAGLMGLVRSLAIDLAPQQITVNAVAPGWIRTGSATPREIEMGDATPLGRSGTPDEVASAIEYLASTGASYVTGQMLVVDGGNSIQDEKG